MNQLGNAKFDNCIFHCSCSLAMLWLMCHYTQPMFTTCTGSSHHLQSKKSENKSISKDPRPKSDTKACKKRIQNQNQKQLEI